MCKRVLCTQGQQPQSSATVAELRQEVVSKGQALCRGDREKITGARVSQTLDLLYLWKPACNFPTLTASLENGVCLSSLQKEKQHGGDTSFPHPSSSPPSPSSSSRKSHLWDTASLPAPSGPPCNFELSHTSPATSLENCPPFTYTLCTNACRSYFPRQISPSVKKIISFKLRCSYSSWGANCSGKKGTCPSPSLYGGSDA